MAGTQLFGSSDAYGSYVPPPVGNNLPAGGSHTAFLVWLVVIGIVLPVIILGSLKVGGWSFVFRGR